MIFKVMTERSKKPELLSLKFILNSRTMIGEQHMKHLKAVDGISEAWISCAEHIDSGFDDLHMISCSGMKESKVSWRTWTSMFLSSQMQWTQMDLTASKSKKKTGRFVDCMRLPTGLSRDLWLCPAIHWHCQFTEPKMSVCDSTRLPFDLNQQLELALVVSHQQSFANFWSICEEMWNEAGKENEGGGKEDKHPFLEHLQLSYKHFDAMTGGDFPWCNCPGVPFKELFFMEDGHKKLKCMIELLTTVLNEVNDLIDSASSDPPQIALTKHGKIPISMVRALMLKTNKSFKHLKAEMGEFRLMIVIQHCALCQLMIQPSLCIHDFLYPVPKLASMNHIVSKLPAEEKANVDNDTIDEIVAGAADVLGIEDWWRSNMETGFCESFNGRSETRFDVIIKGMWLFHLNKNGDAKIKPYNEQDIWEDTLFWTKKRADKAKN